MRPTKFTTVTLNRSSAIDFKEPFDWAEHSHRAIERPDVIEGVSKGINQCEWGAGEE